MGKETSNNKNAKSRSNKPYDTSNSFVRKVASRVSNYLGSFFNNQDETNAENTQESESADQFEEFSAQPTTSKRIKLSSYDSENKVQALSNEKSRQFVLEHGSVRSEIPLSDRQLLSPIEPIAGPSGLQHTKSVGVNNTLTRCFLNDDSQSGIQSKFSSHQMEISDQVRNGPSDDRSESSESTSGCSSLVPQTDRMSQSTFVASRRKALAMDEKLDYARKLKMSRSSMYLNRSIPVALDAPRPSRTPAFDLSAYGSPIFNKSNVREAMLSSPFYSGHTMYGGASARRKSLCTLPSRQSIPVKPASAAPEDLNMSHTAKRILAALEEFSSPLIDAKRIPAPAPFSSKRRTLEVKSPNTTKLPALTVPTVANLIKMRRLEQIQESTAAARQVVGQADAPRDPSPPPWTGKITTKRKNHDQIPRSSISFDQNQPSYELPEIHLPITNLPKFELPVPIIPTSKEKRSPPISTERYIFAAPKVVSENQCGATSISISSYDFSPPAKPDDWTKHKQLPTVVGLTPETVSKLKRKTISTKVPNYCSLFGASNKKDDTQSPSLKPNSSQADKQIADSVGFGDKFKPSEGSWSCGTCMVNNAASALKCVACDTKKSDAITSTTANKSVCSSCLISITCPTGKCLACITKNDKKSTASPQNVDDNTVGDKIKPTPQSWSLPASLVNNAVTSTKSCASEFIKPDDGGKVTIDGFGDKFKPPPGSWSCSECLVNNSATDVKCIVCEAAKPSLTSPSTKIDDKTKLSSGKPMSQPSMKSIDQGTTNQCTTCENSTVDPVTANGPHSASDPWGKTKPSLWECAVCLVRNEEKATKCVACETLRPNGNTSAQSGPKFAFSLPPASSQFKFGIDKADESAKTSTPNGPIKPIGEKGNVSSPFTFGIPSKDTKLQSNAAASAEIMNEEQNSAGNMFSFKSEKSKGNEENAVSTSLFSQSQPKFSFGLSTAVSTLPVTNSNNSITLSTQKVEQASTASTQSFGFNGSTVDKPTISSNFGPVSNITSNLSSPFTFSPFTPAFGSTFPEGKTNAAAPAPAFGQQSSINPSTSNLFNFGAKSTQLESKPFTFSGSTTAFGFKNASSVDSPVVNKQAPNESTGPFKVSSFPNFNPPTNSEPVGSFGMSTSPFVASPATAPSSTPFGTQNTVSFGGFGGQSNNIMQSPFEGRMQSSATSVTPAATPTFGTGFGQAPTLTNPPAQVPFQFGANAGGLFSPGSTPATNLSLSVPQSFNFTGGETPSFSAPPPGPSEPRRIIKARRTQR